MTGIKYVSEGPTTGYGRAAREYIRRLSDLGVPVTWTPMIPGGSRSGRWLRPFEGRNWPDDEFRPLVNRPLDYDLVVLHLQPDDMPDWQAREAGTALVAMTVWESDRLPPHWPALLNTTRGVIVPCQWNHDVFRAAGVRVPMAVVPHVAPREGPVPLPLPAEVRPNDFVFYTIAAWRERNAPHLTLEAFLREFSADEPVSLVLKTTRTSERRCVGGFWNHRVRRHIDTTARQVAAVRRRSGSTARVAVLLDELSDGEVSGLHARADAYISLTRAEGFGLGAYEAAWAGNPVIITGHGGQRDFLPSESALFVAHRMVPYRDPFVGPSAAVNQVGSWWAEPDLGHAGRLMRDLAADPAAARLRGARLQRHVRERFDPQAITERLASFLTQVSGS